MSSLGCTRSLLGFGNNSSLCHKRQPGLARVKKTLKPLKSRRLRSSNLLLLTGVTNKLGLLPIAQR
jgi:hypothetical protein